MTRDLASASSQRAPGVADGAIAAGGSSVTAVLGPTNTGKTHYAVERMLAHKTGVIGFPLRLLAREIYDRIVDLRGPREVALITGEEKIVPKDARYYCCTVESMPLDMGPDFLAVDEIQLCADPERGHVFTDRLLRARGRHETLFLGAETMRGRIQALIPQARFLTRPRLSTLSYAGSKKISRLPGRSAVVAFSADSVYAIAELIRRQKGGAAVVMGALSPRTRNAQVALYQNGDVDHLVATDAIGMGLNLDVKHVAFAGLSKFDGRRMRPLEPQEIGQIAGRAGRHMNDGTFGVTAEARAPDPDLIDAIENHAYRPVRLLQWRNHSLSFGTVPALIASLEAAPPAPGLTRAREADDLRTLRALWSDSEIKDRATGGAAVRLLWDVCQIPDFRKTLTSDHAALSRRIYEFLLSESAVIPPDWMATQVGRLDRADGDIDTLSKRLAYIRTWTYVSNRGRWLDDPEEWRGRTREVEDKLSDALHDRLTQRFVDRRTGVLMRRLKQKESLVAEVSDTGEVTIEGVAVGRLDGFRFSVEGAGSAEGRKLENASLQALQSEFSRRADRFYNSPDTEIDMTEQGGLMWGDAAVGRLEASDDPLSPRVIPFVEDDAEQGVREKVERRLGHWINRRIAALFEPLIAMRDDEAVNGLARGVAFRIVERLGVLPRAEAAADIKTLDQDARGLLRKHGVRFGQHTIFMPALLKPAPTRFRIVLWGLAEKLDEIPAPPPPGLVTVPEVPGAPEGYYERAGYRLAGSRAIRIDMLERLADIIRPMDTRGGFEATADMLSITGCTLEQFAELMQGLSYKAVRGERPKAPQSAKEGDAEVTAEAEAKTVNAPTEGDTKVDVPADAVAPDTPEAPAENSAAPATSEDAPAEPEEAVSDQTDSPPAELAEAPDASTADEAKTDEPAEPEIEVFYTFSYAPRARRPRHDARGPRKEGRADGKGDGKSQRRRKGGDKPGKRDRKGGHKGGKSREFSAAPPRREKKIDPDNPFAVLQQLKDKK